MGRGKKWLVAALAATALTAVGGIDARVASAARPVLEITSTTRLTIAGGVVFRWKGKINGPNVCKPDRSVRVVGGNTSSSKTLAQTKTNANGAFTISAPDKLILVIAVASKRVSGTTCPGDAVMGKRSSG